MSFRNEPVSGLALCFLRTMWLSFGTSEHSVVSLKALSSGAFYFLVRVM